MKPILLPNLPYPAGFDLEVARLSARLILQAYAMFDQWERKKPDEADFQWNRPQPPVPGLVYLEPLWATYRYAQHLPPRHAHETGRVRWVDRLCPIGFLAQDAARLFIVFRGTQTDYEWMKVNLKFLQKDCDFDRFSEGRAHAGFLAYYKTVRRILLQRVEALGLADKEIILTGHSLGGALSTLAAHDLAEENAPNTTFRHYTFGAPRVFNSKLASYYNDLPVSTYRIVNVEDAVTTVPLPVTGKLTYQHVGTPICFSANYGAIGSNHSMENYLHALEHPDQPQAS